MRSKPFILGENDVFLKETAIFCNPAYQVPFVKIIQTRFGNMKVYT